MEKIKLGISACLLGEPVRYDGGHKLDRFMRDTLGRYIEFAPVCPEAECGLGIPREPMRLEGDPEAPRLVTIQTRKDLTDRMVAWAERKVRELEREDLCGFIFKSRSPSSGMARVKVFDEGSIPHERGSGIFAKIFMDHFPLLPVEDEDGLHDPVPRENFIERIFVLGRWREILEKGLHASRLIEFHSRHKLIIMAHSVKHNGLMGKLVAQSGEMPAAEAFKSYGAMLMEALRLRATVKKNTNVLQHVMGYFKKQLTSDEKMELLEIIHDYHEGHLPLVVPVTLLGHHARKFDQAYLESQYYLRPHPIEMQLKNHA